EISADLDAFFENDLFHFDLRLFAESLAFGNAGGGATADVSGYIAFEMAYDGEIKVNACTTDYYDSTVTFSLFDYSTGEVTALDNGNNNDCGFSALALPAGEYALMIEASVYDDSGDEWGTNTDGGLVIAVEYTNSPRRRADLNSDGKIDGGDLTILLAAFGSDDPAADLDQDGVIDGRDLTIILANWGAVFIGDPDVNEDGVVDWADYVLVLSAQNTSLPQYDLNRDGIVDELDLEIVVNAM
ncbi:MAG: dockerin type I domain-containing protein, partial [Pirellulaceae bacterium]|nr:dockerin type I domain-containing protein [Pirellulaceae bacterium]